MTRCPDWVSVTTRTSIGLPCLISNSSWARVGDPVDPDPGAATIAAVVPGDSLEGEDTVGTRELAEAQRHHPRVRCHVTILTLPPMFWVGVKRG